MIASFFCFIVPRSRKKPDITLKTNPTIDQGSFCISNTIPDKPIPITAIHMHPFANEKQKHILLNNLIFKTQRKSPRYKHNITCALYIELVVSQNI